MPFFHFDEFASYYLALPFRALIKATVHTVLPFRSLITYGTVLVATVPCCAVQASPF